MFFGSVLAFFGGRKTKASKEKKEKAGALNSGTLLSQANPGVGNTLLGA